MKKKYIITRSNPNGVKVAEPASYRVGLIGAGLQTILWISEGYRVTVAADLGKIEVKSTLIESFTDGMCPDCGSKSFLEGPSGGACTNYECAGCHHRFNVGIANGRVFHAERI